MIPESFKSNNPISLSFPHHLEQSFLHFTIFSLIFIQLQFSINLTKNYLENFGYDTIAGSKLSGSNANLTSTTGDISIINVMDRDYSRSESSSSRTTLSSVGAGLVQGIAAGVASYYTITNPTLAHNQKYDKIKENKDAAKELPQNQELHQKVTINETAIASNLSFTNLTLNSSKNTNITSSNLTATSVALTINSGTSGTGSN
jgi:hypothetical protein